MANRFEMAYEKHKVAAAEAYRLFAAMCEHKQYRIPGMSTVIRLAWKIEHGCTIEEAAAKEYCYRWHLAVRAGDQVTCGSSTVNEQGERNDAASAWGDPPTTIGM